MIFLTFRPCFLVLVSWPSLVRSCDGITIPWDLKDVCVSLVPLGSFLPTLSLTFLKSSSLCFFFLLFFPIFGENWEKLVLLQNSHVRFAMLEPAMTSNSGSSHESMTCALTPSFLRVSFKREQNGGLHETWKNFFKTGFVNYLALVRNLKCDWNLAN